MMTETQGTKKLTSFCVKMYIFPKAPTIQSLEIEEIHTSPSIKDYTTLAP